MKKSSFFSADRSILKVFIVLAFLVFCLATEKSFSQNMSGQWIGGFSAAEDPSGSKTDYVLEIEVAGTQVSGYSYTYFSISGKRYFVICRLKGIFEKGSKSLSVNEVETVKTNTPKDFKNCLQAHDLTYLKQGDKEILLGKWKPYEKGSDCGKGLTSLERKLLVKTSPSDVSKADKPASKNNSSDISAHPNQKSNAGQVHGKTAPAEEKSNNFPKGNQQSLSEKSSEKKTEQKPVLSMDGGKAKELATEAKEKLSQRNAQVIKTIEVTGPSIKIDIYDNGQVDGDTVSIFMNGALLVPAKMLTAKPITININVNENDDVYDIVMFAESMGTIPPNTALMVVTTSTKRYEINITSTEQTSGSIRLKVKR
jgi:hypothetical protein